MPPRGRDRAACSERGVHALRLHERGPRRDARGPGPRRGAAHRARRSAAASSTRAASARSTTCARSRELRLVNLAGVISGKALYEGRFTVARGRRRALGGRLMLLRRVIPCLDVDKGRVVKGTKFVDIRDAGDPVELAARYEDEGADEIVFLDITASHEKRETVADARAPQRRRRVHPVHDRRRHPLGGGRAGGARRGRRQGVGQLGGGGAARAARASWPRCSAPSAWCSRSTRAARATGYEVYVNGGRTAGRPRRGGVGARGRGARGGGDPADEHGPRRHRGRLRARAHARGGRRRGRAGDRLGRRRHPRPPGRGGRARAAPTPCCARRSSTTASTRCARPRSTCARRASRSGCDAAAPPSASGSGRCRGWTGCCRRSTACRPCTSWAGRCATCCADDDRRWTSTWRWRATPARRRARSPRGSAATRASTSASAPPRSGRRGSSSTSPRPGARPTRSRARCREVEPAPLAEDLARRDFTVNAMAVGLSRRRPRPPLRPARRAWRTPRHGVIRVLHEGSFRRRPHPPAARGALRGTARLPHGRRTPSALAREAVAAGALVDRLGRARSATSCSTCSRELEAPTAVERLGELGIDRALHPALAADPELVASAALGAAAIERGPRACRRSPRSCAARAEELDHWLDELQLDAARARRRRAGGARARRELAAELRDAGPRAVRAARPAGRRAARGAGPGARAGRAARAGAALAVTTSRDVRLEITGDDLLAAGVPEGPAIGRALERDAATEARRARERSRGGARAPRSRSRREPDARAGAPRRAGARSPTAPAA